MKEFVTVKLDGTILVPGGYTTKWPNAKKAKTEDTLPKLGGIPMIPSTQIKGGLRRAALRVILGHRKEKLSTIKEYYFNVVGGVEGKKKKTKGEDGEKPATEKEENVDVSLLAMMAERNKNPITGLFGRGLRGGVMLAGHLYTRNFLASGDFQIEEFRGARADDSRRSPGMMVDMVSSASLDEDLAKMYEKNQARTVLKHQIKALYRELFKASGAKKTELDKQIKELDEKLLLLSGENAVSLPLDGFPYVLSPDFRGSMIAKDVTLVELGLLLYSMEEQMLTDPFLGAHRSSGFGEFSASWTSSAGSITLRPFEPAHVEGDLFLSAREAFLSAVGGFDLSLEAAGEYEEENDD